MNELTTTTPITSVATTFNGITYRSRLEADWAAMFTHLEIYFEYEPQPWRMPSGAVYEPDFYLPNQRTYCEAKGPHNERLWKPREFAAALDAVAWPDGFPGCWQVIVLRPAGPHGEAVWAAADPSCPDPLLTACGGCGGWAFTGVDEYGDHYCRQCGSLDVLPGARFTGGGRMQSDGCLDMVWSPRRVVA